MKTIIVIMPDSLSQDQIKELKKQDVIIIETNNPEKIRVIRSTEGFEGDELIECLSNAILDDNGYVLQRFAKLFLKKLKPPINPISNP